MMENTLEQYNWTPDPRWDNKELSYDVNKHNWPERFLEIAKKIKPELTKLEDIHLYFKPSDLNDLRKYFEKYTNSQEFSKALDDFFEEYITSLVNDPDYLIQSTCGIRVVVPDQEKIGRLLSFHTGYWTGYSNQMGTVWTPLTDTYESNSMQVLTWNDTIKLMKKIHNEKLSLEDIQSLCEEKCWPVNIGVGKSWLFNQGHLHGNINNVTPITRVSFDARWATGNFGPRRAGSFYRPRGVHTDIDKENINKGKWIVFVDQNSKYIGETPHFMIREFLIGYSKKLDIELTEWSNEYWDCTWMPKFRDYVTRDYLSGIVLPSIHAFSCNIETRLELISLAIKNNQQLIFADENLLVKDKQDIKYIEKIYSYNETQ